MIRFRKGIIPSHDEVGSLKVPIVNETNLAQLDANKLESAISSATIDKTKWKSSPILYEWWDTPDRFKRRELDSKECDIINVSFPLLLAKAIGYLIFLALFFNTINKSKI